MFEWNRNIQRLIDSIEESLKEGVGDEITLQNLSQVIAYSPYHTTRQFKELTGISFRDYLRLRKLAYSAIDLRDSREGILPIALRYGFSSQEAYSRAFQKAYGRSPRDYRKNPRPLLFRNKINTFDPYYLGIGENHMDKARLQEVKVWAETLPAHKILYIKNYESHGYFDFWAKQESVPGGDCHTVCGLLDSVKGKLDGNDGELGVFSGQLMFYIYEPDGRVPECYGVRLPADYAGEVPPQMCCDRVPEGEYLIFAHPPFDYETMSSAVAERVEAVMSSYSLEGTEYEYDERNGRIRYWYHSPDVWGYRILRPVKKKSL